MGNWLQVACKWIVAILTPNTFRWLFLHQVRVAVYLKSGQVVKFNCGKINVDYGKSWKVDGLSNHVHFDSTEIVAFREIMWW